MNIAASAWRPLLCIAALLVTLPPTQAQSADKSSTRQVPPPSSEFAIEQQTDRLIIKRGSNLVAHYVFRDGQILRPYFTHVHSPDGTQATRNHPPVAGRDAVDHATMHPGIWLGFGDVSGNDFWRNKAAIRHQRFSEEPEVRDRRVRFATENALVSTNETQIASLACVFTISQVRDGYLLVWDSTVTPKVEGFFFGDQEEMGFGIRVATALTEKNGGVIRSSSGIEKAQDTWGKTFDWCDYSGIIEGRRVGIAVMAHPENFRPSWFHNRDYGLIVANPFGRRAFTKGDPSHVIVRKGQNLRLRWAAFVHSSPASDAPDIAAAHAVFAGMK